MIPQASIAVCLRKVGNEQNEPSAEQRNPRHHIPWARTTAIIRDTSALNRPGHVHPRFQLSSSPTRIPAVLRVLFRLLLRTIVRCARQAWTAGPRTSKPWSRARIKMRGTASMLNNTCYSIAAKKRGARLGGHGRNGCQSISSCEGATSRSSVHYVTLIQALLASDILF
jgi:hypothetical protein